ncbi:hypothetical protein M427DRAFT_27444 [Gonapodya prolifera JEL478]|uniref:P-loop containing nucleoside triphosphate hydrolase protein n=1 Tax=Gonapodya prolifera (strain JEL478) TaxID=1344416 RepID=A0A139AYV1_GONPJ|nr:hypothetical protein M427DRAFT_27444 [Gonapodya prolifera JEL478]|eukprot:KXS21906.1 hypothetical protein M427DRAFT_27444 [Gonapodya prolifera JEL478]
MQLDTENDDDDAYTESGESDFDDQQEVVDRDDSRIKSIKAAAKADESIVPDGDLPESRHEFLAKLESAAGTLPPKPSANATSYDAFVPPPMLNEGVVLRPYQTHGVHILAHLYDKGLNAILADEMGLGKTLQAISFLLHLKYTVRLAPPYLVVVPTSVLSNWVDEIARFAKPNALRVLVYGGSPPERAALRESATASSFDMLLTTPPLITSRSPVDSSFLLSHPYSFLLLDEAHIIKNPSSLLHQTLLSLRPTMARRTAWRTLLLTGTPVQNRVAELHALLAFCNPAFVPRDAADFEAWFEPSARHAHHSVKDADPDGDSKQALLAQLGRAASHVVIRREKSAVLGSTMPKLTETILFVGLTPLQRTLYRSVLARDMSIFSSSASKTNLSNTLTHLLKATSHPYLFPAVEPEPFVQGEHLVSVSAKIDATDRMLAWVRKRRGGSRVLLFSQSTRLLDIVQDICHLRNLPYERLDGSVRGEERWEAVGRFQAGAGGRGRAASGGEGDPGGKGKGKGKGRDEDEEEGDGEDPFVFLLSTKAGGVGLNLTAADTVILLDSSANPTHDLQAVARAHRIGQTRPVRAFRLVARDTVDEVVWRRGKAKVGVGRGVMGWAGGEDGAKEKEDMVKVLKFGLDKVVAGDGSCGEREGLLGEGEVEKVMEAVFEDKNVEKEVVGGRRMVETVTHGGDEPEENGSGAVGDQEDSQIEEDETIYVFEGKDYKSREAAAEAALQTLHEQAQRERSEEEARKVAETLAPRSTRSMAGDSAPSHSGSRQQDLEKERAEKAERDAKRRKQKLERMVKKWVEIGFKSYKIGVEMEMELDDANGRWYWPDLFSASGTPKPASLSSAEGSLEEDQEPDLHPLSGSVTEPNLPDGEIGVLVHVVDDGGQWAKGRGVFGAMDKLDVRIGEYYSLAADLGDLSLGDVHVFPVKSPGSRDNLFVALIVAQKAPKGKEPRSTILSDVLQESFELLSKFAKDLSATKSTKLSVHMPRIGQNVRGFDWYRTERVVRKWLVGAGLDCYVSGSDHNYKRQKIGGSSRDQPDQDEEMQDMQDAKPDKDIFNGDLFFVVADPEPTVSRPTSGIDQTKDSSWARRLIVKHGGRVVENLEGDEFPRFVLLLSSGAEAQSDLRSRLKEMKKRIVAKTGRNVNSPLLVDPEWLDNTIKSGRPTFDD